MLGTFATATVIVIEVGLIGYSMHKQGVFKDLASKFTKQVSSNIDTVIQPTLKRITHV